MSVELNYECWTKLPFKTFQNILNMHSLNNPGARGGSVIFPPPQSFSFSQLTLIYGWIIHDLQTVQIMGSFEKIDPIVGAHPTKLPMTGLFDGHE